MKRIFILLVAALAITGAAVADDNNDLTSGLQKGHSLRGIHAMAVLVEGLGSDVEQAGLHATDIKTVWPLG